MDTNSSLCAFKNIIKVYYVCIYLYIWVKIYTIFESKINCKHFHTRQFQHIFWVLKDVRDDIRKECYGIAYLNL